ncbi:MAG: hypothetical protein FJ265_16565, partial [Planctomycetes bacterium]|nr:hypothetical protein [Planctomycetota bacterium]
MSLTTGIEKLEKVVDRVRTAGRGAVADLLAELKALEQDASHSSLDELARLCRVGAEAITQLAADDASYAPHAETVLQHLARLVDFASACAAAIDAGGDGSTIVPPPLLTVPDPDEEKHFLETVGMFVSHAIGTVAELEEDVLAVEASQAPGETIGEIRRVVHTLKAEFGVLNMAGPQKLCHEAETTIDACTERGRPFPVDVMLECADALKQHLERLTRDVRAEFPDATVLLGKLTAIAAAAAADEGARVELQPGGEFADSLPEFVTEARSHLAEAEAAMLALDAAHGDPEQINLTFRAFHTIKGVAGFLNLQPIVALAHATETLLDRARSQQLAVSRDDVDLVLAAGDTIQQMIHALEGQPAPLQSQLQGLLDRLQRAAGQKTAAAPAAVPPPPAAPVPAAPAPAPAPETAEDEPAPKPPARAAGGEDHEPRAAKVERTVKVSTTRLDMLVDMVGELVISQSMVLQG